MYRETLEAEPVALPEIETQTQSTSDEVTRRLLRAVETYKVSCAINGEEPTVEDSWMVLLSALSFEEDK
jgi:hypothetical protein